MIIKKSMFKKLLAKVLLTFLALYTAFLTILTPAIHAQEWYDQPFKEFYIRVFDTDTSPADEIFGERYTAAQVQWVIWSMLSLPVNFILGPELASCLFTVDWGGIPLGAVFCTDELINRFTFMIQNQQHYAGGLQNDKAVPDNSSFLARYFEVNPLSGVGNIMTKLKKLYLIPEAQAQGFGFSALANPVQALWRASRDITYALFVLTIIVMAFMIMFRTKISPQTVITVQSALPKIVIGLVLVTFSYAIAGFMIDLVYVVIGLISALVLQAGVFTSAETWTDVFAWLTTGGAGNTGAFGILLNYIQIAGTAGFFAIARVMATSVPAFVLGAFGEILWILGYVLIFIWMFIIAFKVFFMLLKTYVAIIFNIMLAPFQIMVGVLVPGMGFGSWLRTLAANLAVFPVVGVMFIFAFMFLFAAAGPFGGGLINILPWGLDFNPSLFPAGSWSPPLLAGGADLQPFLWLIASLATLSLIPKAADMIKSFVSGRPFAYGTAIGEAVAAGMIAPRAAWGATPTRLVRGEVSTRAAAGTLDWLGDRIGRSERFGKWGTRLTKQAERLRSKA